MICWLHREERLKKRYPYFDTLGDSTIGFLQTLTEQYAPRDVYEAAKKKFLVLGKLVGEK